MAGGWFRWSWRRPRATGTVLMELDILTNPGARYVHEAREAEPFEEATPGDPPLPTITITGIPGGGTSG